MIKLFNVFNSVRYKNLILISLLLLITYFTWRQIPDLAIRGDGFVYLIERVRNDRWIFPEVLGKLELGSLLLTRTITPIFKTNMSLYWTTELVVVFLINLLFFCLVYVLTKKPIVAFSASLIQAVNFFGNWDMYAGGIYAYFTDRVPNMLFIIPGFLFLHKYLEEKKTKYLIVSFVLYFIGVGVWHWSLFTTALFFSYPIFWNLFSKNPKKMAFPTTLIAFYYVAVSLFFTYLQNLTQAGLNPRWTFSYFVLHPEKFHYFELTIRQLVYISEYVPVNFINTQIAIQITPHIVVAYMISSIIIFFKLPKQRALLFTLILATFINFFLNLYVGQYQVASQYGSDRYLYIPSFYFSIFWSLFLWIVFFERKFLWKLIGVLVLGAYFSLNYRLISRSFAGVMERHVPTKMIWNKAIELGQSATAKTLIIIPHFETGPYEAEFLNDQVGNKKGVIYVSEYDTFDLKKALPQSTKIIQIKYDSKCSCALEKEISAKALKL